MYPTTIDGVRIGADYEGKEIVVVSFTWTNNSDETTSFALSVHPKVFQNGIECDTAIAMDINNDKYMSDVRPGGSVQVEMAYEIEDHSDVEVEVSELFSFSDDLIASGTFSLE